jgi:hypothetical protein
MISYIIDMKRNRPDEYEKLIRGYKTEEAMLKELYGMTSKAVEAIKRDSKKLS